MRKSARERTVKRRTNSRAPNRDLTHTHTLVDSSASYLHYQLGLAGDFSSYSLHFISIQPIYSTLFFDSCENLNWKKNTHTDNITTTTTTTARIQPRQLPISNKYFVIDLWRRKNRRRRRRVLRTRIIHHITYKKTPTAEAAAVITTTTTKSLTPNM